MTLALPSPDQITAISPDRKLINLWLYGRSPHTQRAYSADVERFMAHIAKPLGAVTLDDLQAFAESLNHLAQDSRRRILASVKSLFSWGHELGYFPFDVGKPLKLPKAKDDLAERILTEAQVHRLILCAKTDRDKALLSLLFASGVRVSECCAIRQRHLVDRDNGSGQITVTGKGKKTRSVLIPASVWAELQPLRKSDDPDAPLFLSREHTPLSDSQVRRIVKRAAQAAGIPCDVCPHALRHSHATIAMERGAPVHLVSATLGHSSVAVTSRYLHARPGDSSANYLGL